jgi:hypothetical protein
MPNGTAKGTEPPDLTPNIYPALRHRMAGLGEVPTAGYGCAPSHRPSFQLPNLRHCHSTLWTGSAVLEPLCSVRVVRRTLTHFLAVLLLCAPLLLNSRFSQLGYLVSRPMKGPRTDLPAYTTRACDLHSTSKARPRTAPNVSPLPELALLPSNTFARDFPHDLARALASCCCLV